MDHYWAHFFNSVHVWFFLSSAWIWYMIKYFFWQAALGLKSAFKYLLFLHLIFISQLFPSLFFCLSVSPFYSVIPTARLKTHFSSFLLTFFPLHLLSSLSLPSLLSASWLSCWCLQQQWKTAKKCLKSNWFLMKFSHMQTQTRTHCDTWYLYSFQIDTRTCPRIQKTFIWNWEETCRWVNEAECLPF